MVTNKNNNASAGSHKGTLSKPDARGVQHCRVEGQRGFAKMAECSGTSQSKTSGSAKSTTGTGASQSKTSGSAKSTTGRGKTSGQSGE